MAAAGCAVTAVDASASAIGRLSKNVALNGLCVSTLTANVFDVLRQWDAPRFDTIVLDPPAFAKSRKSAAAGRRAYKEINLRAFKLLRPGGRLVTCSCSAHMQRADFERVVAEAAADAGRIARIVDRRGAAPDHPTLLGAPETDYLKVLFIDVI
jgi:23S rRNA (cytosine1962-C5)-methyltransferase